MNCKEDTVNYAEMKSCIEDIAKKYFEYLKNTEQKGSKSYIKKVKEAYNKLDQLEQQFINNEFFYQNYPNWWKKIYPKTTYYRIKKKSMVNFLEAFDHAS